MSAPQFRLTCWLYSPGKHVDASAAHLGKLTDEALAGRARAGCASSFEELVRRYQVPLLRFLLHRLPGRSDAEDVLQESFLRAYKRIDRYRDAWPFRTWLFTIAYRIAVSHRRTTRATLPAGALDQFAAEESDESNRLEIDEHRQSLWATVRETLNDEQFAAVWLHYVENQSAAEIAQVLGRSWVAVRTMLHRARKRLVPELANLVNVEQTSAASDLVARASRPR